MSYTSEQYKYLLLRRLQRHFSMPSAKDRAYTLSFFGKLLDDSVTVTEAAYYNFVSLMDDQIEYCAQNNIYACGDITDSMVQSNSALLTNAFAAIGIDLVITTGDTGGKATFTKQNGEILVYNADGLSKADDSNYFYINARANTEYQYARSSAPYYQMENMEVVGLDEINIKSAGLGTYWSYNADTATVTITGDGAYRWAPTDTQLESGEYTTLIISASVSRLLPNALNLASGGTIVLLHPADAPIILDSNFITDDNKTARSLVIYTDNLAVRNYAYGNLITIEWHALDEWEG